MEYLFINFSQIFLLGSVLRIIMSHYIIFHNIIMCYYIIFSSLRVELNDFCTSEHSGTHLDSPVHFAKDAWSVHEIPLRRLFRVPGNVWSIIM